jgi:hypothetical protein
MFICKQNRLRKFTLQQSKATWNFKKGSFRQTVKLVNNEAERGETVVVRKFNSYLQEVVERKRRAKKGQKRKKK